MSGGEKVCARDGCHRPVIGRQASAVYCSPRCQEQANGPAHDIKARERMRQRRQTAEGWAYDIAAGRAKEELARRHRDEFAALRASHYERALIEWQRRRVGG